MDKHEFRGPNLQGFNKVQLIKIIFLNKNPLMKNQNILRQVTAWKRKAKKFHVHGNDNKIHFYVIQNFFTFSKSTYVAILLETVVSITVLLPGKLHINLCFKI